MEIRPVKWIDEVLALVLEYAPTPLADNEDMDEEENTTAAVTVSTGNEEEEQSPVRPH